MPLWLCLCLRWSFVGGEIVGHFFSLWREQTLQLRMNMQVIGQYAWFSELFRVVFFCLFSQKLGQAYQGMFPSGYITYTRVQFAFLLSLWT